MEGSRQVGTPLQEETIQDVDCLKVDVHETSCGIDDKLRKPEER